MLAQRLLHFSLALPILVLLHLLKAIYDGLWRLAVVASSLVPRRRELLADLRKDGFLHFLRTHGSEIFTALQLPTPLHPLDEYLLDCSEQQPVEILAVSDGERIELETLKSVMWNGIFAGSVKGASFPRWLYGRRCWMPLGLASDPAKFKPDVKRMERWLGPEDGPLYLEERIVRCPVDLSKRALEDVLEDIAAEPLDTHRPLWRMFLVEDTSQDPKGEDPKCNVILQCHHTLSDGVAIAALIRRNLFHDPSVDEMVRKLLPFYVRLILSIRVSFFFCCDVFFILVECAMAAFRHKKTVRPWNAKEGGRMLIGTQMPVSLDLIKTVQDSCQAATGGPRPTVNDVVTTAITRAHTRLFVRGDAKLLQLEAEEPRTPATTAPPSLAGTPDFRAEAEASPERMVAEEEGEKTDPRVSTHPDYMSAVVVVNIRTDLAEHLSNRIAPVPFFLRRAEEGEDFVSHAATIRKTLRPLKTRMLAHVWARMIEIGWGVLPRFLTLGIFRELATPTEILLSNLRGPPVVGKWGGSEISGLQFWAPPGANARIAASILSYGGATKLAVSLHSSLVPAFRPAAVREAHGAATIRNDADVLGALVLHELQMAGREAEAVSAF